jgi:hypothetical protein
MQSLSRNTLSDPTIVHTPVRQYGRSVQVRDGTREIATLPRELRERPPVSLDYDMPFPFTGEIGKVVVSLGAAKLEVADREKLQDMGEKAKVAVQ